MLARAFASLVVGLVRRLPPSWRRGLATALGDLVYLLGIRRRVALDNLARAFPELPPAEHRRIARGAYRTVAYSLGEGLASVHYTPAELEQRVRAHNWELVAGAQAAGKGILVASAHLGSWELLADVMGRRGVPMSAVAKPLKGAFNAKIVEARVSSGVKLIAPRGSIPACAKALARNEAVCLLIDQSISARRGVFVPFFGQLASTTPAVSLIARRTGAPVCVALSHWEGDHLEVEIEGPFPVARTGDLHADIQAHTALLTQVIEKQIRRHPEQWLWMHRRWKERPTSPPRHP